ncbi:hypothetical protein AOLI_G00165490 [Acnodon oligacanthus]
MNSLRTPLPACFDGDRVPLFFLPGRGVGKVPRGAPEEYSTGSCLIRLKGRSDILKCWTRPEAPPPSHLQQESTGFSRLLKKHLASHSSTECKIEETRDLVG